MLYLTMICLEMRLWLRSAGFWLALAAMLWFAFYQLGERLLAAHWLSERIITDGLEFAALFILFTSAAAMHRDYAEGTEALMDSLPLTNRKFVLSRWLAGALIWLLVGLVIFTIAGLLTTLQEGAVLNVWPLMTFYLAHYAPAVLFIHTVGLVSGVLIRWPFILYPFLIVFWGALTFAAAEMSWVPGKEHLTLFHFTGIGMRVMRISELVGLYPFESYIFWKRMFFGGLTVGLIAIATIAFRPARERGLANRTKKQLFSFLGMLIAVPFIVSGSFGYIQLYQTPLANIEAASRLSSDIVVTAYDLDVYVEALGDYSVLASLAVHNQGANELETVNLHLFAECRASDAAEANFEQRGNVLTLIPGTPLSPNKTTHLNVTYRCPFYDKHSGLPGPDAPDKVMTSLTYPRIPGQPAAYFAVTVDAPINFKLATNLTKVVEEPIAPDRSVTHFAGQARTLTAFGGPLEYAVIDGIEAYYYPAHAAAARTYTKELADRIHFFETWLGEPQHIPGETLFPVIVESIGMGCLQQCQRVQQHYLEVLEWDLPLYYNPYALTLEQKTHLESQALALWWGQHAMRSPTSVVHTQVEAAANQYLAILYRDYAEGSAAYDNAVDLVKSAQTAQIRSILGFPSWGSLHAGVFLTLHDVRAELGNDALRTVLRALYERHLIRFTNNSGTAATSSEDESLRFLFNTIASLPGGEEVAERALQWLPESARSLDK